MAFAAIAAVLVGGWVRNTQAAPLLLGTGSAIATPANGTAADLNFTLLAQQWVGFYGNLTMNITTVSGGLLYTNQINNGTVYVVNHGASPNWATTTISPPDSSTDGNFSLSGAYITSLMGFSGQTRSNLCGQTSLFYVNTTDNFSVGLERDGNGTTHDNYLCSNVLQIPATQSVLGTSYDWAVIAPSTPGWGGANGYDLYYDGGS